MLKHIRLSEHRGIDNILLSDLGKINIVSGKNNSGKTSLLEAVFRSESRVVGFSDYENELTSLMEEQLGSVNEINMQAIHLFVNRNPIIFSDNIDTLLADKPLQEIDGWPSEGVSIGILREKIIQIIRNRGKEPLNMVFIPPKRALELSIGMGNVAPSPAGKGVLLKLFESYNQLPGSAERNFFSDISEAFETISGGWTFQVRFLPESIKVELRFSYKGQEWRLGQECGLGLQDLIVILYFAIADLYNFIIIEEIETHMHPEMQRKLCVFLGSLDKKQFLISSHSNVVLSSAVVDKLFLAEYAEKITARDMTSLAEVLETVGYSIADNLTSDLVILVEGPNDGVVLEQYLLKMSLLGKYNIKYFAMGGDIMDKQDLTVFRENYNVVALVDSDPMSNKIREVFIKNCEEIGIKPHKLERYAIENYYTLPILREVYGAQIPNSVIEIDPTLKLEKQIKLNVKRKSRELASKMSLKDLKGTDLFEDFLKGVVKKTLERK